MSERAGERRWAKWGVLLVALAGTWSGMARADMFCGGGDPPEPAPSPSSSSSSGAGANYGEVAGLKRPCSGGQPIPFGAVDLGMMAGMVVLGGGAAVSSRGRAKKR